MNGTGVQNDPFIPDNWSDFVTAIGTTGAYISLPVIPIKTKDTYIKTGKLYFDSQGNKITTPVPEDIDNYYENGFMLDANVYAPLGIRLNFEGVNLNGNGASIINCYIPTEDCGLRFAGSGDFTTTYLNNINFLNMLSESSNYWGAISRNGGRSLYTNNVQFSGIIVRGSFCGTNGNDAMFISTTFSLTFGTSAIFMPSELNANNKYYRFCKFDFYGSPLQLFNSSSGNRFINCEMTGKLVGTATTRGNTVLFPSDNSSTTVVTNIDVTEYTGARFDYAGGNGTNPYIINSDKLAQDAYVSNGITRVTTQQLSDATYLRSIGFPCGN